MQGLARGGLGCQWGQRSCQSLPLCRPVCCLLSPRGGSRGPPLAAPEPRKAAAALSWPGRQGPVETWKALGCRHSRWQWLQSSPMTLRGATGTHHRPLCIQGQRSLWEEQRGLGALQEAGYLRLPGPAAPGTHGFPRAAQTPGDAQLGRKPAAQSRGAHLTSGGSVSSSVGWGWKSLLCARRRHSQNCLARNRSLIVSVPDSQPTTSLRCPLTSILQAGSLSLVLGEDPNALLTAEFRHRMASPQQEAVLMRKTLPLATGTGQ